MQRIKTVHKIKPWLRIRRQEDEGSAQSSIASPFIEKNKGEKATPNLRALRLAMTASDALLSMGVPAASVVSRALDITEAYCEQPVHIDITYNLLMLSQIRGLESEPLTLIRPVKIRSTNNMTVQLVQDLVYRIRTGKLRLEEAEKELDSILKHPITYPHWLPSFANAALAAGVELMFSTNWRIILITFIIAWLVDRLVRLLGERAVSPFFRQAVAATFVTLAAAGINQLKNNGVTFFADMHPTIIVVSGIFMLVSGLTIVGAIQDAIDEYYITANARLLRVIMLTAGIVMGILVGLYTAHKLGIGIAINPNPLGLTALHFQIIGGAIAASAFAVATQMRLRAVLWAGLLGGLALGIVYAARSFGISLVPASGVAALIVGILAKGLSRFWRTPASGSVSAGIIPLVPGLSLFTALMQLVNYPPGNPLFVWGLGTLFTTIAIAVSIAAGASFGIVLSRPFNQRRTHLRNVEPFVRFMRAQIKLDRKQTRASRRPAAEGAVASRRSVL